MATLYVEFKLGTGLVIHEKFHADVDVDGHTVRHYLIFFLDQAHMLLPITVGHV